ncbi:hypothetical protein FV232_19785 [Methylobacterium sp. WL30]|uniref:hypothetical protein n=1 Tax=unclassified Methylobacterium TaxID=2615210 RepID=UPI0011CAB6A3|nr:MULTISPECIES: hypothetical protein [unclassified Methylobacterium]TXN41412.1 hypothetical protein FV225_02680 [Methylobacterium sp. WL93]TXN49794.1 hypothetical protein FV227_14970 [Methylobacterium sp. WL119]TXN64867.1 hypothetical protein FV232_19785 [Methylobacterium sp. WL30]
MPRLPSADDLGPAGSLASQRGIASYDLSPLARGEAAIGAGIQKIGDAGLGIGLDMISKDQKEGAVFDKARADAAFIPAHTDLLLKQQDAPDADAYQQGSQTALREAAANIRDPQARELWMLNHASTLASGKVTVKGLTDKRDADHELAGIRTDEDRGLHTIVNAPNQADVDTMVRAVGARYDEAASKGIITEVQAQAAKKAFALRGITARIGMLDPEDQVAAWKGPVTGRNGVIDRIIGVESNGNATARNPNSTATGAGQFTEGTWLATIRSHRPDLLQGRSSAAVLALRNDPDLSREMVGFLADDNGKALAAQGLPQNPTTLYLSHFLGSGGAAAVLKAKPGTPVSDVLGDDQIAANRSILAGKTVDSVIGWAGRKMGDTPEGKLASIIPEDVRETGLRRAESLYATEKRRQQQADREQAGVLQARMSDDLASIEATGQGNAQLRAEDVSQALGPQAAKDWLAQRARSRQVHEALDGIGSLPEGDIERRLQTLEPKPGVDGFTEDMGAYVKARKKADALIQARRADPALAVEDLPAVKAAREAAQYEGPADQKEITPASAQAIVRARLASQRQLGIPEPMAVTRSQAMVLARQLRAIGDDDTAGLKAFVGKLQGTYGEYADEVLTSTIQHQNINRDLAVAATDVLGKISRGQVPNPFDQRRLDRANDGQRLDDAMAGRGVQPASPAPPAAGGQSSAVSPATRNPGAAPTAAVELEARAKLADLKALIQNRADPAVMTEFDATYGPGASKRLLAEVDRRLGTGAQR